MGAGSWSSSVPRSSRRHSGKRAPRAEKLRAGSGARNRRGRRPALGWHPMRKLGFFLYRSQWDAAEKIGEHVRFGTLLALSVFVVGFSASGGDWAALWQTAVGIAAVWLVFSVWALFEAVRRPERSRKLACRRLWRFDWRGRLSASHHDRLTGALVAGVRLGARPASPRSVHEPGLSRLLGRQRERAANLLSATSRRMSPPL
jgi:hypothetical protein